MYNCTCHELWWHWHRVTMHLSFERRFDIVLRLSPSTLSPMSIYLHPYYQVPLLPPTLLCTSSSTTSSLQPCWSIPTPIPSWNFVYFISFILRLEWQDEVGMTKSIIPGSFRTEWWSNETNNLIPHLCHPRPFWHGMIFEWQIPSFRCHSGMTWDECLFAQNISRLLGRAMEGKRNDAEWLRNDRMTQEWWKDKRTTQMTKGW